MYADDGVMMSNDVRKIEKVLADFKLPIAGIYFSKKIRKDGSRACQFVRTNYIDFVGAKLDFNTNMIHSEKGSCSMNDDLRVIMKTIWSDYNKVVE